MTDKNRQRLEIAAVAIIFGAGSGWGAFITGFSGLVQKVDRIEQATTIVGQRVAEMYCSQVPETQRAGCR